LFHTLTKLKTSTLYNELLPTMASKSSGIPYTPSGSTSTIERYISKVLALRKQKKTSPLSRENLRRKKAIAPKKLIQNPTRDPHTVNPPPTRTHSTLATYYKKLKQGSLLPFRNSPVTPAPRVPKEPPPIKQVRFLEVPNFQYQKKVHFLLHLCPKAKQRKNLYPRPLPALRDPHKPPQYLPQPSQRSY